MRWLLLACMLQVMGERPAPKLTREQQAVLAASRRERRLDQLLGPPLQPPPAPKGKQTSPQCCWERSQHVLRCSVSGIDERRHRCLTGLGLHAID